MTARKIGQTPINRIRKCPCCRCHERPRSPSPECRRVGRLRRNNVPEFRKSGTDVPMGAAASARSTEALRSLIEASASRESSAQGHRYSRSWSGSAIQEIGFATFTEARRTREVSSRATGDESPGHRPFCSPAWLDLVRLSSRRQGPGRQRPGHCRAQGGWLCRIP